MFTSIAGRAVVVTGGTRGIGKGIASVFARNGAKVLITGRDAEAARAAAEDLQAVAVAAREPGEVSYVLADVSSREDCRRVAAIAQERLGGVDVLCANAGIFPDGASGGPDRGRPRPGVRHQPEGHDPVGAGLPARPGGVGPRPGHPHLVHHRADHRVPRLDALRREQALGQLGFMRTAAIELAPKGITVNAVLPGNIVTEGLAEMGEDYAAGMTAAIPMRPTGHRGRDRLRRPVPGHRRGRLHHRPDDRRRRRPGAARIARGHGGDHGMSEVSQPADP